MNARSIVLAALVVLAGALLYLDWPLLLAGLHTFHVL